MTVSEYSLELKKWQIWHRVKDMRIELYGGDKKARAHYESVLAENPMIEALLILGCANHDKTLRESIYERSCIRWADGLPGDMLSAVMCNICEVENEAKG